MRDMRLLITADELREADKSLPNPGNWDEGLAVTALRALIHLLEGGTVNGKGLVEVTE